MTETEVSTLPAVQRRDQILQLVTERGFVRVSELSTRFGTSTVTIRTDFAVLESAGQLTRVHGGAIALAGAPDTEPAFEESLTTLWEEKQRIANAGADLVRSGNAIFLDVGTTTLALARALTKRADLTDVVVITNGLTIALELEKAIPQFQVVVLGGTLRPRQHSLVNPLASATVDQVHADLAFIGCNGVSVTHGVTNLNLPEAEIKRLMVGASHRTVVLADSSKIGKVQVGKVASLDDVAVLITGTAAPRSVTSAVADAGVDVIAV